MKNYSNVFVGLTLLFLLFFGISVLVESSAWASAGGGGSSDRRLSAINQA